MEWAVFIARGKGLLTYQSSFGVAHIIASAIPINYISSKRIYNAVRHPKDTLIGQESVTAGYENGPFHTPKRMSTGRIL